MAKDKDGGCLLVFGKFAKELKGFRAGKKQLGFLDFVFGVFESRGKDFSGLKSTEVGTGEHEIRDGADLSSAFGNLFGLLDAFGSEEAFGIGRALGIFAIDGDAVAHDVQLHERGSSWGHSTERSMNVR